MRELERAFHEAVDDDIENSAKAGKLPEKTYSVPVMFRVDASVHARAALAAQLRGISLNQWAEEAVRAHARAASAELEGSGSFLKKRTKKLLRLEVGGAWAALHHVAKGSTFFQNEALYLGCDDRAGPAQGPG